MKKTVTKKSAKKVVKKLTKKSNAKTADTLCSCANNILADKDKVEKDLTA